MRKWAGLKNYAKEKWREVTFVGAAVSGRSFVAVALIPIVLKDAVIKWMEVTGGRIMNMGWTPETVARIHANLSQFEASQIAKRKEAEKKIEDSGIGECSFCLEEIMKNKQQTWESSFLLEYCIKAKDHRHHPKIKVDDDE